MRETNVQMMIQDFQENVSVEGLIQVCGVCTCEPPQVAHLQLSLHFLCPHHGLQLGVGGRVGRGPGSLGFRALGFRFFFPPLLALNVLSWVCF